MKPKNIVILILFALSMSVNAQSWIAINTELDEQPPIIEIIESNDLHCKLKVKIPGLYKTIIEYLDTTYASLGAILTLNCLTWNRWSLAAREKQRWKLNNHLASCQIVCCT